MARMDVISVLTVGLFLNNVFLGLVTSAAINASDLLLENTATNVKSLGPSVLISFNNNTNSSSSSIADNSSTEGSYPVGTRGHATGPVSGNETGNTPHGAVGVGTGKMMALSDDVITDALFTNIDTLQDHLEICEEELRQKMKRFSYYQLMTESADDTANNIDVGEKVYVTNDDSDDEVNLPSLDVDDKRNDDSPDIIPAAAEQRRSLSQKIRQQTRKRRFALITENEQPLEKSDILAQKVVERLSARMSYLRSSLVQCHLLVRQFG